MLKQPRLIAVLLLVVCLLACVTGEASPAEPPPPSELPLGQIKLPPGFKIALYTTESIPGPRQLAVSYKGNAAFPNAVIIYVGTINTPGAVYALLDREGKGTIEMQTVLNNLQRPNGVVWKDGSLYVAQTGSVTRWDDVDAFVLDGTPLAPGTVLSEGFPANQTIHQDHHIAIGPDGWLYISQGAETNTGPCAKYGSLERCTINRMQLDGSDLQTYARGIRNSVGFDWDPKTKALWVGVNERNELYPNPDSHPDDVLVYVPKAGLDFGFPFCHWQGKGNEYQRQLGPGTHYVDDVNIPGGVRNANDTAAFVKYCSQKDIQEPAQALGPHAAPLGMTFYRGSLFPSEYRGSIFMAQHGSADRAQALGYRIMNIGIASNGSVLDYGVFAEGWLQDRSPAKYFGRPVDILELQDGSLLVSDNFADVVYHITYEK